MPKLLIVTNVPSMMREFLLPYAKHFKKLGWQVDAMMKEASTAADACAECQDIFTNIWHVAWSRSPLSPSNFLQAPKTVQDAVRKENYDIIHVHSPVAAFVTRLALRKQQPKPKIIYTAHGFHFHREGNPLKNEIFKTLERTAGPWTDQLIVINKEDEEAAKKYKIMPLDKILYTPGIGLDVNKYKAEQVTKEQTQEIRKDLNIKESDTLILMIAEFNPGKRHKDALNALKATNQTNIILTFAGVGPLEQEVQEQAKTLGLEKQIRMLGYRKDIPQLLKSSNALLLPSEREGLPRSILEAMCAATPVIGTQIRGVEDLLENNHGLMTKVGDTKALAEAMTWIAQNPEEAQTMGKRGQSKMQAFSLENVINMHENLYAKMLNIEVHKEKEVVLT